MRRTRLELLDGFKNLEVSFMTHHKQKSMVFLEEDKNNLSPKQMMLFHSLHLNLTNKKQIPLKKFLTQSQDKDNSKLQATPMSLLPKLNISNKLKTKRTKLELQDGYKNLEVSFMIHQLLSSTVFLEEEISNLLLKVKKNLILFHSLHPNLINKKLILFKKFLKLFPDKDNLKLPAIKMLLLLKRNISTKLRMKRIKLELQDGFKNQEDLFILHQRLQDTVLLKLRHTRLKQPQMRAERSSKSTSKLPPMLSQLKILKKTREPLKLQKWTHKT